MCRKSHMRAWCVISLGLGLILGHCLESWLLCCGGGSGCIFLGFCMLGQKPGF